MTTTYVVGVGARAGAPLGDLEVLLAQALTAAGCTPAQVRALATVDHKATEPAICQLAARYDWPLQTFPAQVLAEQPVARPSVRVAQLVATASVAEAAAIAATRSAHGAGVLVVHKLVTGAATLAVARYAA